MKNLAPLMTSNSGDWMTPSWVLELASETMGGIDLDPCADMGHRVPAKRHYTLVDDAFTQDWRASSIYCNPPFGRVIGKWVDKLVTEFEAGNVQQAIALLPARVDTAWWQMVADYPVCFLTGRLSFLQAGPDGTPVKGDAAPFPTAIVYLGPHVARFVHLWHKKGCMYLPVYDTGGE